MIAPLTLRQMIDASRLEATKVAIVATLAPLLKGVAIEAYPGKLDINDVVAKAIVKAPGIALGWTRTRANRDIGGTFATPVEWAAYIITEDFADTAATPPRRVARDVVAHGIGSFLLRILHDPDASSWGLKGIMNPAPDPVPALVPVMTMKTAEAGTAVFAVTWTQVLVLEGASLFGGPTPRVAAVPDGYEFDEPGDGEIPTEILAILRGEVEP